MALSYDIETTSSSADIVIHGMSSLGANNISLRIFLNNSFVEWVEDIDTTWLLDYTYTYDGLDPDTSYSFEIEFWDYRIVVDTISGSFTTESGGGGGGDQPYFNSWAEGDTNIYVNAYDLRYVDYDRVYYEIDSGSYSDSYTGLGSHTFEDLPSGDYTVRAYYIYRNSYYTIYTDRGDSYITVSIGGGGGGGGDWQLYEERAGTVSSSFEFPYRNGLSGMTLYRMSITFSQNATVTFSTSGNGDTMGWLSEYNQTSWDDTTGRPNNYVANDDDSGSGANFMLSYSCTAGNVYYLWYRAYSDSGYSGQITLSVEIGGGGTTWSYDAVSGFNNLSAETTKAVTISQGVGQYFGVSFANSGTAVISVPSGANLDLFVTDANYGYDTADGYPFTYSGKASSSLTQTVNVSSGSTYYVWVKGATASVSGGITITITPPSAQHTWTYTLASSITNPSSTVTRNYTLTAGNGYYMAVRFSDAGTAVFYTEGSADDIAYLTSSDSGYDYDTGIPNAIVASNDDDGTGSNFRIEYTVTANTTYYLWFRMYGASNSGSVTLYVVPPAAPSSVGYVWIYTTGGWKKAKPYIYISGGWVPATPYIYSGGSWKPTS